MVALVKRLIVKVADLCPLCIVFLFNLVSLFLVYLHVYMAC